ncbi:hypothetical protein [Staphylococcus ratti]|uniref:Uncharacterized protein n=1 Tax=Staphylococcus ratti TaxID=2892440 RepID=A0ABY3PCZ1_9STAP|nr:hypothetical protein [Staphylococcus ratti]UEX90171.1 hypothetical protein LN051_00385 [Staphylococcus ratti]
MAKKRKVYLILLIITALAVYALPQITGNYHFSTRVFEIIPFIFFVLFLFSSDDKQD